jgi:hypothetical protein
MVITIKEKNVLRSLAGKWMEFANLPVMHERKRLWTALKDLRAERPMVLFETWFLEGYVSDKELESTDPFIRETEKHLRWMIRHANEVGDDIVLESFYRIYWDIVGTDYGVPIEINRIADGKGGEWGFSYKHPIKRPEEIKKLCHQSWSVKREQTMRRYEILSEIFGDILPINLHGTGSQFIGLTSELFKLIGNDNLIQWTVDEPDTLLDLMSFLRDDRVSYYKWLEEEGLLGYNHTGWEMIGSGSPGYTSNYPIGGISHNPRLVDLWVWMESQETSMISPTMFGRFFLPFMAEVCSLFGLVYYGCCEPVHDRWDLIIQAIPHIRAVSISPWCNQQMMAQKLGKKVVFSRKPKPWLISGTDPDWGELEKDVRETYLAARDCNLEFIYRDVYRIEGDRPRLRRWVELVRSVFNS